MANNGQPVSFDDIIQAGRKKAAAEKLAQEIFGKKGRSSAPPTGPKANLGGSLASRMGVKKRNSPSPRNAAIAPRPRNPPPTRPSAQDIRRPKLSHTQSSAPDLGGKSHKNGLASEEAAANGGAELNIKGAASGPYIVVAQNFAPGTTAEDIESVMLSVGGQMSACKLVASNPTVIAEMTFIEKAGAEKVIETFNGKKADGRPLYVYWKSNRGAGSKPAPSQPQTVSQQQPPPAPSNAVQTDDVVMEVDDNAESREAENRLREERRSRDDRGPREVFPTGPRGYQAEMDRYDDRRVRRPEPAYQDGRYGFGGGGYQYGPRRGYRRDDRGYGGQSWRP